MILNDWLIFAYGTVLCKIRSPLCIILFLVPIFVQGQAPALSSGDDWDPKVLANPQTSSSLFENGGFPQTTMAYWDSKLISDVVNESSTYARADQNSFHGAIGNCTWYVYGRIAELRDLGLINYDRASSILADLRNAPRPRHAKFWDNMISGNWQTTTNYIKLDPSYRKPGAIVMWDGGTYGHIGIVEEVSLDGKQFRVSHFNYWGCANKGDQTAMCDFKKIGRLFSHWMSYDDETCVQLRVFPKFLVIE